jgi:hypothetical protein
MATAPNTAADADLDSYYRERVGALTERLLDVSEELFGKKAAQQRREFENLVERRLQNGAKFIPRKRQPR